MIVALAFAVVAALMLAGFVVLEMKSKSEVETARAAGKHARRAQNLLTALNEIPRGYLRGPEVRRILSDAFQNAEVLTQIRTGPFAEQGLAIKANIQEKLKLINEIDSGAPPTSSITSSKRVEVVREAAKYLYEYVARKVHFNSDYYTDSDSFLTNLDFSRVRAVTDYYNNGAAVHLKNGEDSRARLYLERAADILQPWVSKLDWAARAHQDFQGRAKKLEKAAPKGSAIDKEWEDWANEDSWKKKAMYD